jgi:hypothetical protein
MCKSLFFSYPLQLCCSTLAAAVTYCTGDKASLWCYFFIHVFTNLNFILPWLIKVVSKFLLVILKISPSFLQDVTIALPLTYLLTPWSRVLLEKLTGSAVSQEIPCIFGTRRYSQVPANCPYPEPTPSSPHNPLPLPEDPSNIILPSCHSTRCCMQWYRYRYIE